MALSKIKKEILAQTAHAEFSAPTNEVLAFCPSCKAFQTVWFTNGKLNQTRKFMQNGNRIYHDCGSSDPCSLFVSV